MQKVLIVYYSNTGNNRYLANQLSTDLGADKVELVPNASSFFMQLLFTQTKISFGLKKLALDPAKYEIVILVGPIWTGSLINPLHSFLKKYATKINRLSFLTCCGSKDGDKDGKWGYQQVFNSIQDLLNTKCERCIALPITLVIPEEKHDDGDFVMQTRLSDDNFKGEIKARYLEFIRAIKN